MSTLTPTLVARKERARALARADVLALGAVGLLTLGVAILTWGTWGDLDSDTGYDIVAGSRIAHGELPYADFTYFYGPLSAFLAGIASLVGGDGFGPAVALGFGITAALLAVTYGLARTQVGALGAALATAITCAVAFVPNNYSYVLPHTSAATLGTLLLLVLLLCLYQRRASGRLVWLSAAGIALGLLALTKPEPAAAGIVAVTLWLWFEEAPHRGRAALRVATPAVAVSLLVYGLVSLASSPGEILFDNLWPEEVMAAGGSTLVEARMPLDAASFAELGTRLLAYAAGVALLVLVSRRVRIWLPAAVALGVAAGVGAALLEPEKLREVLKWAWAWIPAGALIALVVLLRRRRLTRVHPSDAGTAVALPAAAALAAVAFTAYGGFFLHATRPQMAVYYAPLAAILVARLHLVELGRPAAAMGAMWVAFLAAAGLGLSLNDASRESGVVSGSGGKLAETPAEAHLYGEALRWIDRRTEPGEPILVGPLLTGLYVLADRESPLRELSLLPSALPSEQAERAAIARLEASGVNLAITDRRDWPGYGHGSFGGTFDRVLAAWIAENFDRETTLTAAGSPPRALDVWIKRRSR